MCPPLLIAAAVMGVGSAVAGAVGSENARAAQESAAEKALRVQEEAARQQQKNYEEQQANQRPWLDAGKASLADLAAQMRAGSFNNTMDPSKLANDPGYQFRMAEGQKALERSASSRGMLASGGAMKSLSRYSQGLASEEFGNAWNRNEMSNTNRYNRLASMAGIGQQAANTLGAMGGQYNGMLGQNAAQVSGIYGDIGNARAAGAMGTANAIQGGIQTFGNMATLGMMSQGGQQIPTQYGYSGGAPSYGQSTMGYQTQGYGPWR